MLIKDHHIQYFRLYLLLIYHYTLSVPSYSNNNIDINDIGIYEFVFEGLPNPPDLEGTDEDRLFELQRMKKCTRAIAQER